MIMNDQEQQDPYVSKAQLQKLIANYQRRVKRLRKGGSAAVDHDPKFDSKSCWLSRETVETLFKINNADGLRIYFGVHDKDIMPTEYDDKLMVVLVATKNVGGVNQDQLFDREEEPQTKSLASRPGDKPGYGVNHTLICPPHNC